MLLWLLVGYMMLHGIWPGSWPSMPGICMAGKPEPMLGIRGMPSGENCSPGASSLMMSLGGCPYLRGDFVVCG